MIVYVRQRGIKEMWRCGESERKTLGCARARGKIEGEGIICTKFLSTGRRTMGARAHARARGTIEWEVEGEGRKAMGGCGGRGGDEEDVEGKYFRCIFGQRVYMRLTSWLNAAIFVHACVLGRRCGARTFVSAALALVWLWKTDERSSKSRQITGEAAQLFDL